MTIHGLLAGCGPCVTRRGILAAGASAGAAAALTGCSVYGGSSDTDTDTDTAAKAGTGDAAADGTSATGGNNAGGAGGGLAKVSDVPVGGGKIFSAHAVVVTQPTAGTFKAFSTTCTHAGCAVTEVSAGEINCPCHNSSFKITDGSVAGGPARKPLTPKKITVEGDTLRLG